MHFIASLQRVGRWEVAAAIVTLVCVLFGQTIVSALAEPIITTLAKGLLAGATPANLLALQLSVLIIQMILIALVSMCGGVLAAAVAIVIARDRFKEADQAVFAALASVLLLGVPLLVAVWPGQAPTLLPRAWLYAATVPGWLLGLPLGGGPVIRAAYTARVIAGLAAATATVAVATLLIPQESVPFATRPLALSQTVTPTFHMISTPGQKLPVEPVKPEEPPPGKPVLPYDGPDIEAVSAIAASRDQAITIQGSRLGRLAAYRGISPYIRVLDLTRGWSAGMKAVHFADPAILAVGGWSDGTITLCGFPGSGPEAGDLVEIDVWNPQSAIGPATFRTTVTKGPGLPCAPPAAAPASAQPAPARAACVYQVSRPCQRTKWEPGDPGAMCRFGVTRSCNDTKDWELVNQTTDRQMPGPWRLPGGIGRGSLVSVTAQTIEIDGRIDGGSQADLTATEGGIILLGKADQDCSAKGAVGQKSTVNLVGDSVRIDGAIAGGSTVNISAPVGAVALNPNSVPPCPASGGIVDASHVTASAKSISLYGALLGGSTVALTATDGEVVLSDNIGQGWCGATGTIDTGSSATVSARSIHLDGRIDSGSTVTLTASGGPVILAKSTAGDCRDQGAIEGRSRVTIAAGSIQIDSKIGGASVVDIAALTGGVAIAGGIDSGAHATIRADGDIAIGGPVSGRDTEIHWCAPHLLLSSPPSGGAQAIKLPDCTFPG